MTPSLVSSNPLAEEGSDAQRDLCHERLTRWLHRRAGRRLRLDGTRARRDLEVAPEGDIAIGGARLAAEAAASGLIDEYRVMVYPVLVGGGVPFFPQRERRVDLELVETRTFSSTVVYLLRYRLAR
jgi:hypothetical protein